MSKKQTAVEWLEKNIRLEMSPFELIECFNQGKQMEKEQIMAAYDKGVNDGENGRYIDPEQYYNETYGKSN